MKRLILKKLIVISQSEAKSLEVPFVAGLNIIMGGNKTGKSSIIKSIFTAFGCECPKIESDWKQLISSYILFFTVDNADYCIQRIKDRFTLFAVDKAGACSCMIDTSAFHEYSNALMDILQIKMPCIDRKGKQFNITPPLLFRFQYIDQDEGWGKIGQAFTNVRYIEKWKENTNKLVSGFHTEEYFELIRQSVIKQNEIKDARAEYSHNEAFVKRIEGIIGTDQSISPANIQSELEELLAATDTLRKEEFAVRTEISHIENELFVFTQQLKSARASLREAKKDASFAMNQGDCLICPVCGAQYDNSIDKQLHIAAEHASAENLVEFLSDQVNMRREILKDLQNMLVSLLSNIQNNEAQIDKYTRHLSYRTYYADAGKREVLNSCKEELVRLDTKIVNLVGAKGIIDDDKRKLTTRKRKKEVSDSIAAYCGVIADKINLSRTYIKLSDFVQKVDKSGSETPRLVYMYHAALYLYNLNRLKSPFNFLVIDTPNQQGQDDENLSGIFESLRLLQSENGQVIVGTERSTGLEREAKNVIRLKEKRRCLTAEHYQEHLELSQHLHTLGLRWANEDYSSNKKSE